jgi:lysophospholipase L1-like esterase
MVALGDSFSSGEGAPPFEPGTDTAQNSCHRSLQAWPVLVAQDLHENVAFLACSGAKVADIVRGDSSNHQPERRIPQLSRLAATPDVDLVTLTIGGNDVKFANVLTYCSAWPRCDIHFANNGNDLLDPLIKQLGSDLSELYRQVRRAAPEARVLVLGYPRLFPLRPHTPTCAPSRGASAIGKAEIRYLNAKTAALNTAIREAAAGQVQFVDVEDAFAGHEVSCGGGQWINHFGVAKKFPYTMHPNEPGQQRLATSAAAALGASHGARHCGRVEGRRGAFFVEVSQGRLSCTKALGIIDYVLHHGQPSQAEPGRSPRGWSCGYGYGKDVDGNQVRAGPSCSRRSVLVRGTQTNLRPL